MHTDGPPETPSGPGPADAPGARSASAAPPVYQPPGIAWEEPFEPMAATSCAFSNPFEQNCMARPMT